MGAGALQAISHNNSIDVKNMLADLTYTNRDLLENSEISFRLWDNYQDVDVFAQIFPATYLNMQGNPMYTSTIGGLDTILLYNYSDTNTVRFGMGIDYMDYDIDQNKNFGPGVPVQFGPLVNISDTQYVYMDDQHRDHFYMLVQDEWTFAQDWEVTIGVRFDEFSDFGNTTNPRVALVWEAHETLTTKLLYGSAFHAPDMGQLYNKNNPMANGNPKLDSETSDTYELVFDFLPNNKLLTRLNLFYYEIEDLVLWLPDPPPATTRTA